MDEVTNIRDKGNKYSVLPHFLTKKFLHVFLILF